MALPIANTPCLDTDNAKKFSNVVKSDLKNIVGAVPTPKLAQAKQLILDHAARENCGKSTTRECIPEKLGKEE